MALTNTQLEEIRSGLQSGNLLVNIVRGMKIEETLPEVREQLFDTFGKQEIIALITGARNIANGKIPGIPTFALVHGMIREKVEPRVSDLTPEYVDKMIGNLNRAITRLMEIKSNL